MVRWSIAVPAVATPGEAWSRSATTCCPGANRPPAGAPPAGGRRRRQRLWLFWREPATRVGPEVQPPRRARLAISPSPTVPGLAAQRSGVDDVFALFHPDAPARRLWLFWASQRRSRTRDLALRSRTRWRVAYRVKEGADPRRNDDWGEVQKMPAADDGEHDREPCALPNGDREACELFWGLYTAVAAGPSWRRGMNRDGRLPRRDPSGWSTPRGRGALAVAFGDEWATPARRPLQRERALWSGVQPSRRPRRPLCGNYHVPDAQPDLLRRRGQRTTTRALTLSTPPPATNSTED